MSRKSFFFYQDEKIEVDAEHMTGAQIKEAIKARVSDFDLSHELVLEGQGNHPDQVVTDDQTVSLQPGHGEGPKRFFSRPPTNFGGIVWCPR